MDDMDGVPSEASRALQVLQESLGRSVLAVYLFGSCVAGGLRPDSDVDVLAVVDSNLAAAARRELVEALMQVSGIPGNSAGLRPLELTLVALAEIVPWRYPPRRELVYGEWLRERFERGEVPAPAHDPDLVIVLKNVRDNSIPLLGPEAIVVLDPVPVADVRRAMHDSLSGLIGGIHGDERNVLLTLARMWLTAAEGEIVPKDRAAEWAIARLDRGSAPLLDLARRGYLGEHDDDWAGREAEVVALALCMKQSIEQCLSVRIQP